jgi:hypothetical protein
VSSISSNILSQQLLKPIAVEKIILFCDDNQPDTTQSEFISKLQGSQQNNIVQTSSARGTIREECISAPILKFDRKDLTIILQNIE